MSQSNINAMLIIISVILTIILLIRTNVISSLVKRLLPRPDVTRFEVEMTRLKKIIDDCDIREKRNVSELELYKMSERIINGGGWSWTMSKDPDEVIYTDNFAKLFDVVPGQIITAKALMDIVHIEDRERVNTQLRDAFDKGENYIIQYRIVRRNNRNDLIKCWGEVVKNEMGATIKINGSIILLETDVD